MTTSNDVFDLRDEVATSLAAQGRTGCTFVANGHVYVGMGMRTWRAVRSDNGGFELKDCDGIY